MIYPIIFWSMQALSLVALVWVYTKLEKSKSATNFDVALFFVPFVLWIALMSTGLRPKSLANLIEPFVIFPLLLGCLSLRTFALPNWSNQNRSQIGFLAGLFVALAVYFLMPALPE
jgi:hypothetical protein